MESKVTSCNTNLSFQSLMHAHLHLQLLILSDSRRCVQYVVANLESKNAGILSGRCQSIVFGACASTILTLKNCQQCEVEIAKRRMKPSSSLGLRTPRSATDVLKDACPPQSTGCLICEKCAEVRDLPDAWKILA